MVTLDLGLVGGASADPGLGCVVSTAVSQVLVDALVGIPILVVSVCSCSCPAQHGGDGDNGSDSVDWDLPFLVLEEEQILVSISMVESSGDP